MRCTLLSLKNCIIFRTTTEDDTAADAVTLVGASSFIFAISCELVDCCSMHIRGEGAVFLCFYAAGLTPCNSAHTPINMSKSTFASGTAHTVPTDMRKALLADTAAHALWEGLTPLARNEWICWVTFVKQEKTRSEHIVRLVAELKEGKRRPCCWIGCIHRTDKAISPSVKGILNKRAKKK